MEVKPVKSYKTPNYPDKYVIIRNPNILKSLPERWKGNAKIGIALSSVVMLMMSGCGGKVAGGYGGAATNEGDKGEVTVKQTDNTILVAPIFNHGTGRGSFGCVSVAPPAFLSEAEAFEVISEEAEREGIQIEKDGLKLDRVKLPMTNLFYDPDNKQSVNLKSKKGSLELDGYDKSRKIAYEFISQKDIVEWKDENQGVMSSVESFDALGTAERLKTGLEGRTEGNTVALFYDPMGFEKEIHEKYNQEFRKIDEKLSDDERNKKWTEINERYENELKETKKTMLREQVKDFLDWLKAQGVI